VGDVITRVSLLFFGPLHLALGPNRKELFASLNKNNWAKIRIIRALHWPSAFVVRKL